jgi:hypothetical protein
VRVRVGELIWVCEFKKKQSGIFAIALILTLFLYPGRDLNPHEHFCSQDFKSCVSTNSTTRADMFLIETALRKKALLRGALHLSERRDSNPRPRPWQGRALPTELLSQLGYKSIYSFETAKQKIKSQSFFLFR